MPPRRKDFVSHFPRTVFILFFALLVFVSGCLGGGIEKTGSVVSHHNGKIKTYGGGAFTIGVLPKIWQQKKIKERAILFLHEDGATITVSSWCKTAVDQTSLEALSAQLVTGLAGSSKIESENRLIDGKNALRTSVSGNVDGTPIYLRSYVLKANQCVFDFFYLASPEALPSVQDFENMVDGFHLLRSHK